MLTDKAQYLTAGIHIGMKTCTPYMKQFVYKIREDGLSVFNLQQVDDRIRIAADFLTNFEHILVVSRKENGHKAVEAFAKAIGAKAIAGRFIPGTLTNPRYKGFTEPDVVVLIDPLIDSQVIEEAKRKRIPIVALCDTFNIVRDIDVVVPLNNNGRKSIALAFWILAKEILKKRGDIKQDTEFTFTLKDFGDEDKPSSDLTEEEQLQKEMDKKNKRQRKKEPV